MKIFQVIAFFFSLFFIVGASSCGGGTEGEFGITAAKVKDDRSLEAFVTAAKKHLETNYNRAVVDFEDQKQWKDGSIYLFGLKRDGSFLFHVQSPLLEGNTLEDSDTIADLLEEGFEEGGGYVIYYVDNPEIEGSDRSKKVVYVLPFEREGEEYLIASGYYPGDEL